MINESLFFDTKIEYALNYENKFYSGKYSFTWLKYGTQVDLAFLMRLNRSVESNHRNQYRNQRPNNSNNQNVDDLVENMGNLAIRNNNRNGNNNRNRNRNTDNLSWARNRRYDN
jgi:hypothetical protein